MIKSIRSFFFLYFASVLILLASDASAQCSVNAGNDTILCQNSLFTRTAIVSPTGASVQWYQLGNSSSILSNTATLNITPRISDTVFYIAKATSGSAPNVCNVFDTVRVIVRSSPRVNAGGDRSICQKGELNLTASIFPASATVNWYAVGSTSSLSNSSTFSVPTTNAGTYNYYVKADSAGICSTNDTLRVIVNPKPVANFTFVVTCGRRVSFTSSSTTSTGTITGYQWNFGTTGGVNSQLPNPQFTYPRTPGTFSVQLIVTNSFGCKDTIIRSVTTTTSLEASLSGVDPSPSDYRGQTYFIQCDANLSSYTFTFFNNSPTASLNTTSTIIWGDNTPNTVITNWQTGAAGQLTHTYGLGTHFLKLIVTNGSCSDSTTYGVYLGTNPGGSISAPSTGTVGCTGSTFSFPFSGCSANSPGTTYYIYVNDGSDSVVYTQENLPPSFIHTFDSTSCGTTSNGIPNTFNITYLIVNPCLSTPGNIGGIRISRKAKADFSISPDDTVCVNTPVLLTDNSLGALTVGSAPTCSPGKSIWSVSPATGWTITSGSLGTDMGFPLNADSWAAGSTNLGITFSVPGTYTVKLISGSSRCGNDTMVKTICVNPTPTAIINLSPDNGCSPLQVTANGSTNTPTCGQNTFLWTVTYASTSGCTPANSDFAFINGTNASSQNPQFNFVSPGVYTVSLQTFAPNARCSSQVVSKSVNVRAKPIVTLSGIPATICQNLPVSPTATASCYIDNNSVYAWTFSNATPSTSSQISPGSIQFNTTGQQTIGLTVTNVCGPTTAQQNITVKPVPNVTPLPDISRCVGQASGNINFTGSLSGTTYNWTNSDPRIGIGASGSGNIASVNVTNPTSSTITARIIVTPELNNCTGNPDTFNINVNPNPAVTVNSPSICRGDSAILTASGADIYTWSPAAGLSATTGNPVKASPANTATYTVTGVTTATTCSSTATATVTVKPVPAITGTKTDPSSCATATGSITISGLIAGSAGYVLTYDKNGVPQTAVNFTTGAGVTTYSISNLTAGVYSNIIVTLNGCPSNALSFSLTDPNPPATPVVTNNGPVCSGGTLNLTATTTTTGTTAWSWSGPNGFTSNLASTAINGVATIASGTYSVTVTIANCTSAAGTTVVVIDSTPPRPAVSSNSPVCSGNPLTLSGSVAGNPTVIWNWTGPAAFSSNQQNPTVSNAATTGMSGNYSLVAIANFTAPARSCSSAVVSTNVVVNPTPAITLASSTGPTNCATATGTITLSGLTNNTQYQVSYTGPSGPQSQPLTTNGSGQIIINGLRSGSYSNISVSLNNCPSNIVGPVSLADPNPPPAPGVANVNPVCSGGTLNLSASTGASGTPTWSWTGPNGFTSNLASPVINGVATIASGVYSVTLTIASCTSPASNVTVVIDSTPPRPAVSSNSPVCSGNPLTLSGSVAGNPTVTWSWTGPAAFSSNQQNPTVSNAATTGMSGNYSLVAIANFTAPARSCSSAVVSTNVVVNPTPAITLASSTGPTNCATATGTITLSGLTNNTQYQVSYTGQSGPQTQPLTSNGSGQIIINGLRSGSYSNISVSLNNCPSNIVGPVSLADPNPPPAPGVANVNPVCSGGTLNLSASTGASGTPTWSWTGPNGFTSNLASPVINGVATIASGVYSVTLTIASCTSPASNVTVVIDSTPPRPAVSSNSPVCSGNPLTLSGSVAGNPTVTWSWTGPAAFSSNQQNPTVSNAATTGMSGNYSLVAIANFTAPARSCTSAVATLNVVVKPTPVISGFTSINPSECASSTGSITLNGLTRDSSYRVRYTTISGQRDTTVVANASGQIIIRNLKAGTYSDIYVDLRNCESGRVGPMSLVDPNPPAPPRAAAVAPLCSGKTISLSAQTDTTGTITWSWTGPNGFSSSSQNPSISGAITAMSGTYSVTMTIANCTSPAASTTVVVDSTPVKPTVSSNSPVCRGNRLTLSGSTVSTISPLTWSWTGPLSYTSSSQNPTVTDSATTNMSGNYTLMVTAIYAAHNCPSDTSAVNVVVNPTPVIGSFTKIDPVNCASPTGSITLTGLAPGTPYTVYYTTTGGQRDSSVTSSGSGEVIIRNLRAGTYSNIYVASLNCPSLPVGPVELKDPTPPPAPLVSSNSPICAGLDLRLEANPAPYPITGTTSWLWTGPNGYASDNQNPIRSQTDTTMSGTYFVTITINNCTSQAASVAVVVNPRPAAPTVTTPVVYCQRGVAQPLTANAVASNTLLWYTTATGGVGSSAAPVPSTTNTGTTSYYVSQLTPENCEGPRTQIDVVVNPTPAVTDQEQTICSGTNFSITPSGSGVPVNTLYSWNVLTVTGGMTGGATGSSQSVISGTLFNPTDFIQTATYRVLPQTGNCPGDSFTVTISVNPAPRVNFSVTDQIICSGETSQPINITSPTPGASIPWTANQPAGISGVETSGTDVIPAQTLTNRTSGSVVVTYIATAVTSGTNGCPGAPVNYTITVNPKPLITNQTSTICSGGNFDFVPVDNPPANIVPTGTTYTWRVSSNNNISGQQDQLGNPVSRISDTLINLTNVPQQIIYTVTPQSGSSGNCTGDPFTLTVTVNPAPVIPFLFDTICSGTSFSLTPQNGNPASSVIVPAGTVYSWAVPIQPIGFSGAVAGTNSPDINGTLTNSTFAPGNIIYRVAPSSGASGNCAGDSFDVTITVNPRASINNNPLWQEVCTGGTTTPVNWTSFTAGATYSWTLVHSGNVTGYLPDGSGPTLASMQLFNPGTARDSVVYAVSSTANACAGAPTNYIIYVNPDAQARISYPADTACWPFNMQIQNTSPSTANRAYTWYANGQLIGQTTAFPGYTIPGPSDSVWIKLFAESLYGCLNDSISHVFHTKPKPMPSFVFEPRDSCGPLQARFRNTTPLLDTFRYAWDFGDGQVSNASNPGTITFFPSPYFSDTTYYIRLRAFNECDAITFVDSIVVRSKPKARFGISSTNGCSPFRVTISNTSIANENSIYYWDFGNGNRDTLYDRRSFEYTYFVANEPDTFDLKLVVVNPCGADTQITRIRVAPNTIRPLININAQDLFGCVPHTIQFQNSSLGATEYNWNFGDGTTLITRDTLNPVYHTYLMEGQFTVTVSMTNGCSDTSQQLQVTVYPRIQPAFTVNTVYCDGDTVRVRNTTPGANQYRWYWGDGQMSTGQEPFHVYAQSGTYTILLYAERSNSNGLVCIDSTSRTINIQAGPDMQLQTNIANVNCAPFTLNAILPAIISEDVKWYIYDTATAAQPVVVSGPQLQYTFARPGTFTVWAYVLTAAGCKDSVSFSVTVRGTPQASFAPGNISVCKRDTTISYLNTSTYNDFGPLTYRWFVNGNLSGTLGNFTYRYLAAPNVTLPLQFETRLVATNSVGCSDTATAILQMNPDPQAAFVLINPDQCVPFVPDVNNASVNADRYEWFLNGSLVDTARIPRFTIRDATTSYTVRLITYNRFNCRPDTASFSFVSRSKPIASFRLNDTLGCTGYLNVITTNTSQFASFYRWDWGDATPGSSFTSPTHAYNRNGRYLITLVASDGTCTDTTSRYVVVSEKPVVDFDADVKTSCDSARVQFSNLTRNAVNYTWYFGDGRRSDLINPYHVFAPSNGLYAVSLLAINADGCRDSLTKAGLIRAIVIPDAGFVVNPGPVISIPNYSFSFLNTTLENPQYKYLWNLGDGSTSSTRDITHKYADTGSYPVRLIVLDFNTGCPDTVIKTVRIEGQPGYLYVPNAFYPNSLQNQFRWFRPLGKGLKDYRLQVFDAWGKLLFETTELDAAGSPVVGWDGTYKGQPMPQDAYAWRITAVFRNGRKWEGMTYTQNEKGLPGHTFGTVTLFR